MWEGHLGRMSAQVLLQAVTLLQHSTSCCRASRLEAGTAEEGRALGKAQHMGAVSTPERRAVTLVLIPSLGRVPDTHHIFDSLQKCWERGSTTFILQLMQQA